VQKFVCMLYFLVCCHVSSVVRFMIYFVISDFILSKMHVHFPRWFQVIICDLEVSSLEFVF
jgi:hypothetical protein